jgi:hypothetical protein
MGRGRASMAAYSRAGCGGFSPCSLEKNLAKTRDSAPISDKITQKSLFSERVSLIFTRATIGLYSRESAVLAWKPP